MMTYMTRQGLLDAVNQSSPALGWDTKYPNLFGKYGFTRVGVLDSWVWFDSDTITESARCSGHLPLSDASDEELLEMLSMERGYWVDRYETWLKQAEEKIHRLEDMLF